MLHKHTCHILTCHVTSQVWHLELWPKIHWQYLFWPYIDLTTELITIQNYLGQNNTWLPKNYNLISEPILHIATPISPNWKTNFIPNFISILPLIIPNVCDHFQVNPKMLQKCHIFACQVTSHVWHLEYWPKIHREYWLWPYLDPTTEFTTIRSSSYLGQNNRWLQKNYYLFFQSQFYTLPRPYLLIGSHTSFKISSPYSHWSYQRFATTFKLIWQC